MKGNKRGDTSEAPFRSPIDHSLSKNFNKTGKRGSNASSVPVRARLRPRSRTGCWICRARKVKCDEGRPTCVRCTQLGYTCSYDTRFTFRENTRRIKELMLKDTIVGDNPVWGTMSLVPSEDIIGSVTDELAAFASLTTDEERERKAKCARPGKYNVIANPESFQHIPEHSVNLEAKALLPLRRGSVAVPLASTLVPLLGDPNIVILKHFEENSKQTIEDPHSLSSAPLLGIKIEEDSVCTKPDPHRLLIPKAAESDQDLKYVQRFRSMVWKQLVQVEVKNKSGMELSSADMLENLANFFPPLFHGMLALAALSLAQKDCKARMDALEHYDQSTSALQSTLRNTQNLFSDGIFLTHFLLLVYEISAAEFCHWNLWSYHLSTLLQILKLRQEVYNGERYPFIAWEIFNLDLDALISGAGRGAIVEIMLREEMVPPPGFHLYPLGSDGLSIIHAHEISTLPTILQLNYEMTLLAARLALLAQELRHDIPTSTEDMSSRQHHFDAMLYQCRVNELQESFRALWLADCVVKIRQQVCRMPLRSVQLFDHLSSLYHACMIYSHTSMWPSQRLAGKLEANAEIANAVGDILLIAAKMVNSNRPKLKSLIFPLFMAGFASTDGSQKMMAMDLIQRMEEWSIGGNNMMTRRVLGIVYERQTKSYMLNGHYRDVEWLNVMAEHGLRVLNFGL